MPCIDVPQYIQAFAVDGGGTGYVQVASSAGFYVGALAYLWRNDAGARVIITEIKDATHVGVRIVADDNENQQALQVYGGRSDLTDYTVAKSSKLSMPAQVVKVEASTWVTPRYLNV